MLLLHKALQRQPIATAGALASATQLTPATINKTLAHLEKLGIVGRLNERRRGRVFGYRWYVELLNAELEPAGWACKSRKPITRLKKRDASTREASGRRCDLWRG